MLGAETSWPVVVSGMTVTRTAAPAKRTIKANAAPAVLNRQSLPEAGDSMLRKAANRSGLSRRSSKRLSSRVHVSVGARRSWPCPGEVLPQQPFHFLVG